MLDTLFNYYLENRGWLVFSIIPTLIFIIVLIDNQRNERKSLGWLIALFTCLVVFVPAAVYDLGPVETRAALKDARRIMFIAGILGMIVPIMLLVGYWFSNYTRRYSIGGASYPLYDNTPGKVEPPPPPTPIQQDHTIPSANPPPPSIAVPPVAPSFDENPNIQSNGPVRIPPAQPSGYPPVPVNSGEKSTILGSAPQFQQQVNAWLIHVDNPQQRYRLQVGRNVIGRGETHAVNLLHDTVSRKGHAAIIVKDNLATVFDLGARSGVKLNGYRIDKAERLEHGDEITLGEVILRYVRT